MRKRLIRTRKVKKVKSNSPKRRKYEKQSRRDISMKSKCPAFLKRIDKSRKTQ